MKPSRVWHRIYSDFFMRGRLDAYRQLLLEALSRNYVVCSIAHFWEQLKNGRVQSGQKYLVLRHDVDTDPPAAREMWLIEESLGIKASYYFRLSTLELPLLSAIAASGGEASYHYEELSTVAKRKLLKTPEEVFREMPLIRQTFKRNLLALRKQTGIPMRIVAAHGDFVNRKLRLFNEEVLKDSGFRRETGIELEVYDDAYRRHITSRHVDNFYPYGWMSEDPLKAIRGDAKAVEIVLHPRHWRTNLRENLKFEVRRVWEGICYCIGGTRF